MLSSLEQLGDERQRLREEERKVLDEMLGTRARLAKIKEDLRASRNARDEINETVRALKKTRDELRESVRKTFATLRQLGGGAGSSSAGMRVERELSQLEWKVQTSTLEKGEEKQMMTKIRSLESKAGAYRKSRQLEDQVALSRKEADELHQKIRELATESQTHHEQIVHLEKVSQELRTRLDENRKMLDNLRQKSASVSREYASLRDHAKQADRLLRLEKEKAYKETLKETAKRKLSQGGKVSLDELSALYGDEE